MAATYQEGLYWGRVIAQQVGESKQKKTPQFVLTFTVLGSVDPANPDGALLRCPNGNRSVFRYFTDNTIDFVIEDIRCLCAAKGVTDALPSFRFLDPNTPGFFDFTGAELGFYCKHESYEGEYKERWSIARGGGKPDVAPLDDKGLKALDSLFGKKLKETKADPRPVPKSNGEKPATTRKERIEEVRQETQAAMEAAPEDIPF